VRKESISFLLSAVLPFLVSCRSGELPVNSGFITERNAVPPSRNIRAEAGLDHAPPALVSAIALDSLGNTAMILAADNGSAAEYNGWERNYRLGFIFSKAVDVGSVRSALNCEPFLGIITESQPGYADTVVCRFADFPLFGVSYDISLGNAVRDRAGNTLEKKTRWRIRAGGERPMPPILRGLRFPKVPGSLSELLVYTPENLFADFPIEAENYAFDRGVDTWMELYFETASGADLDPLSLTDRLKFSAANGALDFSPRLIVLSSFTALNPVAGWKKFRRAEIRGVLTNRPHTGMVTVEIGAGLKDSLGNKSNEAQRFLFLK